MDHTDPTPPASASAASTHSESVLTSLGKAIFAPMAGAHDGVALPHTHVDTAPTPKAGLRPEDTHRPRVLSSIGKAMLAPIEGSHGGLSGVARPRPLSAHGGEPEEKAPDDRDPRVVGKKSDNPLESLGKAIVAPVEGADEGAGTPGSMPPEDTPK